MALSAAAWSALNSYWEFEELGTNDRVDSHGSNDFNVASNISRVTGVVNYAASLDGTTDYLSASDDSTLDGGNADYTWAFWVYFDRLDPQILYKGIWNSVKDYRFYLDGSDQISFSVGDSGGEIDSVSNGSAASTGQWYFVCGWHDVSEDTIYLQVDNGTIYSTNYTGTPAVNSTSLSVGYNYFGRSQLRIDEAAFFQGYVLTADERSFLYNSGNGRAYADLLDQSITVTPGTLTLTGVSVTVTATSLAQSITVTPGTLTLTGVSVSVVQHIRVTPGTLTLTGIAVAVTNDYSVVVTAGTLTLTGVAAKINRYINVSPGLLTLTPVALGVTNDSLLDWTLADALTYDWTLADALQYDWTVEDALTYDWTLADRVE